MSTLDILYVFRVTFRTKTDCWSYNETIFYFVDLPERHKKQSKKRSEMAQVNNSMWLEMGDKQSLLGRQINCLMLESHVRSEVSFNKKKWKTFSISLVGNELEMTDCGDP